MESFVVQPDSGVTTFLLLVAGLLKETMKMGLVGTEQGMSTMQLKRRVDGKQLKLM